MNTGVKARSGAINSVQQAYRSVRPLPSHSKGGDAFHRLTNYPLHRVYLARFILVARLVNAEIIDPWLAGTVGSPELEERIAKVLGNRQCPALLEY